MNLSEIEAFIMVSHTKSMTKAAERLGITTMTVSRRLASLEQALGTRLMHRTTRAVALTDEGWEFLPYAKNLAEAEKSAKNLFSPGNRTVTGQLRVTAPTGFGRRTVIPLLPELLATNPELRIELELSDGITDLVGKGFDVAIRIGPLRDSRLIAHRLADNPRVLCAAPAYLEQYGSPARLADLSQHNCLRLSGVLQWGFVINNSISAVSVEGRFTGSSVEGVRALCVAGCGIAQLSLWDVREELNAGELVRLDLEDAQAQMLAIWALLPTTRYLPSRVTLFLNTLKNKMGLPT